MKKLLLLGVGLFFLASFARAQVLLTFDKSVAGMEKATDSDQSNGVQVGPGLDSVYWSSKMSAAAIAIHWDSTGQHARMDLGDGKGNATYIVPNGAQILTFWVYLDSSQHVPDSLQIDTYGMDNTNWSWTETNADQHFAKDIPKNIWFPISFPMAARLAANPNFQYNSSAAGKGFMTGLQVFPHYKAAVGWHGTIYVKSAVLIGAMPTDMETFATGLGNFKLGWANGWATTIVPDVGLIGGNLGTVKFQIRDTIPAPTGTAYAANVSDGGNFDFSNQNFLVAWIYADSTLPDSTQVIFYCQDRSNWTDPKPIYPATIYGKNLPKNTWYPFYFDLSAMNILDSTSFNAAKNKIGWFGIMLGAPAEAGGDTLVKSATVHIYKIQMLNSVVAVAPPVWVAADFEGKGSGPNAGKQGFYVPNYAYGTLSRAADLATSNGTYVLQAAADFSKSPHEFAVVRDSVVMHDADSTATQVSFQVYLPSKATAGGLVTFYLSGGAKDSISVVDTIGTAAMKASQWNTMTLAKLDSLAAIGKFDPTKAAQVGVVITYPGNTATWAANLLFDNLVVTGIWFPQEVPDGVKSLDVVKEFKLYNNYPNPFNPSTVIRYDVAKTSKVLLQVYDVLGRVVATVVDQQQPTGSYNVSFDGSKFASGVYFFRLTAGSYVKTQKMVLLK